MYFGRDDPCDFVKDQSSYRYVCITEVSLLSNRATVQGVIRWPISEEPRARSQVVPYAKCDERSGSETGISLSNFDFLCWYHSTHILFLCNR